MNRDHLAILALSLFTSAGLSAQAPERTAASGFDAARLHRIDTWMQSYVDSNQIGGAVGLVLRDGRVVYQHAVGWVDKESGRRMTANALFRIASQTKAVTTVAILSLVEEGKIAVDDPVSRWIPAFAHTTVAVKGDTGLGIVAARRQIAIRDLLTHTSGIATGLDPLVARAYAAKGLGSEAGFWWYFADKDETICTTVERLATLPFAAQPGERWIYGYSIDVLACVAERASGMPFDQLIRERITGPLEMNDTYFYVPPAAAQRLVTVYASDSGGHATRAPEGPRGQGNYVRGPRKDFSGGAGLISTALDYARFLEMLRNGGQLGGVRILAPHTVDLMTHNQVGTLYDSSAARGFGFGFETTERYGGDGMRSAGSSGWGGAYASNYVTDPAEHMVIIFMMNQLPNHTDINSKFPTMVYQALVR